MEENIILRADTVENLKIFSEITGKSQSTLIEEALENYFDTLQKQMLQKSMIDENAQTNLSYDEFWEGVDIDES